MSKVIYNDRHLGFGQNLKSQYPAVYQTLVAQGLTDKQIEADRTNATVIQAVEAARKSNPLAVRMNELYDAYKKFANVPVTDTFNRVANALEAMCCSNTRYNKRAISRMLARAVQNSNPWDEFLMLLQPEFVPGIEEQIHNLFEQYVTLLTNNAEHFRLLNEAKAEKQAFWAKHGFSFQKGEYFYIDDGLVIVTYDERFVKPELLDSDRFEEDCGGYEEVQFNAYVNEDIVQLLMRTQQKKLMMDYINLLCRVKDGNCPVEKFPELMQFLSEHSDF